MKVFEFGYDKPGGAENKALGRETQKPVPVTRRYRRFVTTRIYDTAVRRWECISRITRETATVIGQSSVINCDRRVSDVYIITFGHHHELGSRSSFAVLQFHVFFF